MDKFLEHQHSMLISTAIEEAAKLTANSFRSHYLRRMENEWEQAKQDLMESIRPGVAGT